MESIRLINICEADIGYLFGIGEKTVQRWVTSGLSQNADGSFTLSKTCRWVIAQHKKQLASAATSRVLTQQQLAELFGVSRQTITAWGRAGLPRQKDNLYDLSDICKWLFIYHHEQAKREYRDRLNAINRKLERNTKQLLKFIRTVNYF